MVNKELKQLEKVADGIDMIESAVKELEELAEEYQKWIDDAYDSGEDTYSDQLIDEKIETEALISDLKFLKNLIKTEAIRTKTFSDLKKLGPAIDSCKGLLKNAINFKRLGSNMGTFMEQLSNNRQSLHDLRKQLQNRKSPKPVVSERLKPKPKEDSDAVKREKEARLIRKMKRDEQKKTPVTAEPAKVSTDIDDIDAILADINKKN